MIKLIVIEGSKTQSRFFAEPQISIGRSDQNHLQLNDRKSSRAHCRIDRVAEGYKLVDLDSQNGTLLNGQQISQKILRPGDQIGIGEAKIFFQRAPEEFRQDERAEQRDKLSAKLRKLVDDAYRSLGEEGLFEGERVFAELLEKRGMSSLRTLEDRYQRLVKLQETSKALNSELQLNKLLALVIDNAIELTGAARGFIIVFNREGKMEIPVARNFDREFIHKPDFKISKSIAEEVGISGRAILTANASDDDRFSSSMSVMKLNLCSILCVPVTSPDRMLGVIYLDNPFQEGVFSRDDLAILTTFAAQSAVALRNSMLVEELSDSKKRLEEAVQAPRPEQAPPKPVLTTPNPRERSEFKHDYSKIVGSSDRMFEIFEVLDKVIDSDVPVLIQGASGTGKELIAHAIHENSPRRKKSFVSENCAAIAGTLLESELFGYAKGAFTGAQSNKIGLFEIADGGTIFLDEIGDTSIDMQKKLLRVLQEGEFRPVGSGRTVKVDVRLISATNRDLRAMIKNKEFREDLFYRINVINVTMPALRERREDIPQLAEHFLAKYAREHDTEPKTLSPQALAYLVNYDWPGNVRELENEILRAIALSDGVIEPEILSESFFPKEAARGGDSVPLGERTLKEIVTAETQKVERRVITEALKQAGWKKTQAAKILGISRPTLDAKIDTYDLKKPSE